MRKADLILASDIKLKLIAFSSYIPLPGIASSQALECFVEQIIDSTRRIKYITKIKEKSLSPAIADPSQPYFNPLKAAIWHKQQGNIDEAFWLIFLFVHFGKHSVNNWGLIRDVYGRFASGQTWDWKTTSSNPQNFKVWNSQNQLILSATGRFGNHRKYENLKANHARGTAEILRSYIEWVGPTRNHIQMMQQAKNTVGNDPKKLFNYLYGSLDSVIRFGRTAKFDYLTMVGKIGLENIEPGSAYISSATGPNRGAKLLFGSNVHANIRSNILEANLSELNEYLDLYFGWQVLEDSLCNWQKSPNKYIYFKG